MLAREERQLRISVSRQQDHGKNFAAWIRRFLLFALNFLLNHNFLFTLVGHFNKKWHFLNTIFVAYPANEKYAREYSFSWYRNKIRWTPWLAGIFCQNGKWGLMTAVSSIEKDFYKLENYGNLKNLVEATEGLRCLLGAEQKTFAGVLPGILFAKGLICESVEADVTVRAVTLAINEVQQCEEYPKDCPVVVLGGRGFIGARLVEQLGTSAICVDVNDGRAWADCLFGQEVILVNLTKRAVLGQYIPLFWGNLVLLNEVYPEPSAQELESLDKIGCNAYHIVGVKAKSYPNLPKAYRGGIPCCAAWLSDKMEVIVRRLN